MPVRDGRNFDLRKEVVLAQAAKTLCEGEETAGRPGPSRHGQFQSA